MMFTVGYDHDNLRLSCEGRSEISEKNDYSSMLNISGVALFQWKDVLPALEFRSYSPSHAAVGTCPKRRVWPP